MMGHSLFILGFFVCADSESYSMVHVHAKCTNKNVTDDKRNVEFKNEVIHNKTSLYS